MCSLLNSVFFLNTYYVPRAGAGGLLGTVPQTQLGQACGHRTFRSPEGTASQESEIPGPAQVTRDRGAHRVCCRGRPCSPRAEPAEGGPEPQRPAGLERAPRSHHARISLCPKPPPASHGPDALTGKTCAHLFCLM